MRSLTPRSDCKNFAPCKNGRSMYHCRICQQLGPYCKFFPNVEKKDLNQKPPKGGWRVTKEMHDNFHRQRRK